MSEASPNTTSLQDHVTSSFAALVSSGKVQEIVEAQVTRLVEGVVKDTLRQYSDFGKALEEYVKGVLTFDPEKMEGVQQYNELVHRLLSEKLSGYMDGSLKGHLEPYIDRLLAGGPQSMKLSDLVELCRDNHQYDAEHGSWGYMEVEVEHSDNDYYHVYIHLNGPKACSKYSADYRLDITRDGEVYSLSMGSDKHEPRPKSKHPLAITPRYGFEAALFRLRTYSMTLEVDYGEGTEEIEYAEHC